MISVSFLKSKLSTKETLRKIDNSNADFIHVDLMDGIYVQEKNFELDDIINLLKDVSKPLDIHLMVNNPYIYISGLAKLKPKIITIHLDSTNDPLEVIKLIKEYNIMVGVAINPNENINILDKYINLIDYVLIMSVYPGKGGQNFIPNVLNKINGLNNKNVLVGIDGGINSDSIKLLKSYNLYNIVSGSFICMNDNYNEQINILKKLLSN